MASKNWVDMEYGSDFYLGEIKVAQFRKSSINNWCILSCQLPSFDTGLPIKVADPLLAKSEIEYTVDNWLKKASLSKNGKKES